MKGTASRGLICIFHGVVKLSGRIDKYIFQPYMTKYTIMDNRNTPDQLVISNEFGRAVFSPLAGSSLRSLQIVTAEGDICELLTGGDGALDPLQLPRGTGSFMMCPWPNNIKQGILHAEGRTYELPTNGPQNAAHGLTRDQSWALVNAEDTRIQLITKLQDPWPFPGSVIFNAHLSGPALIMELKVTNDGGDTFPAGFGWHPWFRRYIGDSTIRIKVPGQLSAWDIDTKRHGTGSETRVPVDLNLTRLVEPEIGKFDHCFRNEPRKPVKLQWPDIATLLMESSDEMTHLVVYTPPESVCVEPISCTVDAFRLEAEGIKDTGTRHIQPGGGMSGWTKWSWG